MKTTIGITVFFILFGSMAGFFAIEKGLFQSRLAKLDGVASLSSTQNGRYDPIEYTPTELQSLLKKRKEKYVVIDARTKLEYDKAHVPGAVHADYYDIDALKKSAGNKIPVAYDEFSAMRAIYAAYLLYQAGYNNVAIIYGGLNAWAEDIQTLESTDLQAQIQTFFNHPKNIFPERKKGEYPLNKGSVEFNIIAKKFSFEPNQIVVEHGQKVILHIVSKDIIYGFALPEYKIEEELLPNEHKHITFLVDRKGNFPFVTNVVSGGQYSSMVGNIIVK